MGVSPTLVVGETSVNGSLNNSGYVAVTGDGTRAISASYDSTSGKTVIGVVDTATGVRVGNIITVTGSPSPVSLRDRRFCAPS